MAHPAKKIAVLKALASNPRILKARLRALGFLFRYMKGFRIQRAGRNLILHSHLPPLNSRAYGRFVDEHLVARSAGPSHAQVGLTDRCPQNCAYCYNRGRKGTPMDTATILRVIRELRELGVFWLGFTGGEPLLNKDIVGLTEAAGLCREVFGRLGVREDDLVFGTLNAGHPGGSLPLGPETAESLHDPRLPGNLYVADATLLPRALGAPPILTIMALARKVARVCS